MMPALVGTGDARRVGYLDPVIQNLPLYKGWLDGLRDHSWIEGKNLIIDYRSAEGLSKHRKH